MTENEIAKFSIKSFARKVRHIMLIVLYILLACVLILTGILLAVSSGKIEPFLDKNGKTLKNSIAEKISVEINDSMQGMIIRGKNINNPVLLFVHGGPGMPEYFLVDKYPTNLEDYFTVCYWEQRGTGLSYNSNISPESIITEQLISDTLVVTNYLRERFGQEKIYLLAHSGGTYLGIQTAARAPERYYAYIGISQISQQRESEKLCHKYMLEQYKTASNKEIVKKMEKYPVNESDTAYNSYLSSFVRGEALHDLGVGTMHDMKSEFSGIFIPVMQCRAYTFREKINIWRGKSLNNSTDHYNQVFGADLTTKVQQLEIPVYFFSGIYDYNVSYTLSKAYFEKLQVPTKGFYTFEQSAHSPLFEEPGKFLNIMKDDVLNGKTELADTK